MSIYLVDSDKMPTLSYSILCLNLADGMFPNNMYNDETKDSCYAEKSRRRVYWGMSDNTIEPDGRGRRVVPDQFSCVALAPRRTSRLVPADHISSRFHTICRRRCGSRPPGPVRTTTQLRRRPVRLFIRKT